MMQGERDQPASLARRTEPESERPVRTPPLAAARFLGVPLQGPYSAAKAATRLLIDTCRIEFAAHGIKFVTVYPGFVATEKTLEDGMPAPLEISEARAVDHILFALRHERADYLFPFTMRWLTRLALVLPKAITNRILANEIPPLPPMDLAGTSEAERKNAADPAATPEGREI